MRFIRRFFNPIFMENRPDVCYNKCKEVMQMSPFGFGFDMFSVMNAIFPIAFLAILVFIIFVVIKGLKEWSHNNAQPQIPAEALIVAKRGQRHHHNNSSHHTSETYYVTFQFRSGDRTEIQVPPREYGMLAEGDEGVVTLQGTRFIHFDRRFSSADTYRNDAYSRPPRSYDDDKKDHNYGQEQQY